MSEFQVQAYSVSIGSFRSATDPFLVSFGAAFSLSVITEITLVDYDGELSLESVSETSVQVGEDDQGQITGITVRALQNSDEDVPALPRMVVIERANVADYLLIPIDETGRILPLSDTVQSGWTAIDLVEWSSPIVLRQVASNTPPIAEDDIEETDEDTPVYIDILGNDSDADGDDLQVSLGTPSNGTVVLDDQGLLYSPSANFNGTASFAYSVDDGRGGSASATVTINVMPVDDAPIASDDVGFEAEFATDLEISATSLLENDGDGDPELEQSLNILSVGDAQAGSVVLVGDMITFTPAGDFSGEAEFKYTMTDGSGQNSVAAVIITVGPAPDEPELIEGGTGPEQLAGTEGQDQIVANGGSDFLTGNGGGDVFVFSFAGGDGREVATITDYTPGEDFIDLGGASVLSHSTAGGSTFLFLDTGDFDTIICQGISSIDQISFA